MLLKENIFIKVFSDAHCPGKILFRDKQIEIMKNVFDKFFGNYIITGSSGAGKTSTLKYVLSQYPGKNIYFSASEKITSNKILRQILNESKTQERHDLIQKMIKNLRDEPKVMVFDEVDKITDLEDFFSILNEIYRNIKIPILLVSNKPKIIHQIPQDAYSTLFFQQINFPPYDALELKEIIIGRIEEADRNILEYISMGCIEKIAAIGCRDGSARKALFMIYNCIMENNYNLDFIDEVEKRMMREDWNVWIDSLTELEKDFLVQVLELSYKDLMGENIRDFSASKFQEVMPNLSPQRISQLITFFENAGILKSNYINKGRSGGRFRTVSFVNQDIFSKLNGLL